MGSALTALVTCGSAIAISNFVPYGPEGVRNLIGDFLPPSPSPSAAGVARGNYGFTFDAVPPRPSPSIARP